VLWLGWDGSAIPELAEIELFLFAPRFDLDGRELALPKISRDVETVELAGTVLIAAEQPLNSRVDKPFKPLPIKAVPIIDRISVTQISELALCPYRYFSSALLNLRPLEKTSYWELSRRRLGTLAHDILEKVLPRLVQGEDIQVETLVTISAFQEREWQTVRQALHTFLFDEKSVMSRRQQTLQQVEKPFELPISFTFDSHQHTVTIVGRMDRLDQLEDGSWLVMDYKTKGGTIGPLERQEMVKLIRPQIPLYMLAVEHLFGGPVAGGLEIRLRSNKQGGLVLDKYKDRFKAASFMKCTADQFLSLFSKEVDQLLHKLVERHYLPGPTSRLQCGLNSCPFWRLCRFDWPVTTEED